MLNKKEHCILSRNSKGNLVIAETNMLKSGKSIEKTHKFSAKKIDRSLSWAPIREMY
jgi:hypothetical protein